MTDSYYESFAADGSFVASIFVTWLLMCLAAVVLSVVLYILQALGIYTIANRRQIKNPWLAWLPIGNLWILGSISDQYRYVVKGKVCNRRKILLGFSVAIVVSYVVLWAGCIMRFTSMLMQTGTQDYMAIAQGVLLMDPPMLIVLYSTLAMLVLAIVLIVIVYMACYDLFVSGRPEIATLFTVLSVVFPAILPIFVFACRKHDGGMPPRKSDVNPQPLEIPQA